MLYQRGTALPQTALWLLKVVQETSMQQWQMHHQKKAWLRGYYFVVCLGPLMLENIFKFNTY